LSYIQDFPLDVIKIDKSFIDGLREGSDAGALPDAIITLAKALKLKTVAEGVERDEQMKRLETLGCDLGQGYLFAEPLSALEVADHLALDAEQARDKNNVAA
jgi:EAL domain-containing protein (putative c-di-GMP-specific phosphodiesterase class I)